MISRIVSLLRRVLHFYLEPVNARPSDHGPPPAVAPLNPPKAERLQDSGWGAEMKEVWLKSWPDLSDERIEEWLRQL
jgi:hypothetical protein